MTLSVNSLLKIFHLDVIKLQVVRFIAAQGLEIRLLIWPNFMLQENSQKSEKMYF
jgi:hypothetical protein